MVSCDYSSEDDPTSDNSLFSVETSTLKPVKIDVSPANDVLVSNLRVKVLKNEGIPSFKEYRITYARFDGDPHVPDPIMVPIDSSNIIIEEDNLIIQKMLVLRHEALLQPPLNLLKGTQSVLEIVASIEFFGEDNEGNAVSLLFTLFLECSDL
jgi:hypothetical protein